MENLFIELLQVSLGTREMLSRIPSAAEWVALYQESQRQAVLSLMVDGLERLPQEQLPKQVFLLQWIGLAQMNEGAYHLHYEKAKELTSRLRNKGYPSCVLKGIGFAQYYPNPPRRQCGDIDMWVKGDRKNVMEYLNSEYEISGVVWHHVVVHIFRDVETEIHFSPIWLHNPFRNANLQRWFKGERDRQIQMNDFLDFVNPAVGFNAVYSILHSFHHLTEEGIGLRHIVDYYYILKALPAEERPSVVALLEKFGLLGFTRAIMWILHDICGMPSEYLLCELDEKEGCFLFDEIMRGGNFGHYRNDNRQRNSIGRFLALLPHYPGEVLWVVPWKIWHRCWIAIH
jgi:hypothetical protein